VLWDQGIKGIGVYRILGFFCRRSYLRPAEFLGWWLWGGAARELLSG
jgi:hypothetical protein